MLTRRSLLAATAAALATSALADPAWDETTRAARGQEVFWNAWAGDDRTNAFIAWTAERMKVLHQVQVRHVRLRDTSEAVARVVAEKSAGRDQGGSVDLIWINGPNFLSMLQQGLLYGPVLDRLPNAALIDRTGKPSTMTDFTVPTGGFEVPWRMARIVFVYDSARVPAPPRSMAAMWEWYAALRPSLRRAGNNFPDTGPAQRALLNDGELDIMISFNPSEAVARVIAEKSAGRNQGGSVDLIWINGPNFLSMLQQGLLYGRVLDRLPNAALIDRAGKPTTMTDFAVPTGGFEVP